MEWNTLKSALDKCKTTEEAYKELRALNTEELKEFISAHRAVDKMTGLDMNQKVLSVIARNILAEKSVKLKEVDDGYLCPKCDHICHWDETICPSCGRNNMEELS